MNYNILNLKYLVILALCIASIFTMAPFTSHAQSQTPEPIIDWQKRVSENQMLSSLGENLMGDSINYNTGLVTFRHTDVSIPGNNQLIVAVSRKLTRGVLYDAENSSEFGDWELLVPRITAITAEESNFRTGDRCSGANPFQRVSIKRKSNPSNPYQTRFFTPFLEGYEYASGISISTPEFGEETLRVIRGTSEHPFPVGTKYGTHSHLKVTCLENITGGGQGFVAVAPNGNSYRFDYFYELRSEDQLFSNLQDAFAKRYRTIVAATEVTDIHGNWVRYDYDNQHRLTRIYSNDLREITFTYSTNTNLIDKVTANGREWSYAYDTATQIHQYQEWHPIELDGQDYHTLTDVTLPDDRTWSFMTEEMNRAADIDGCTPLGSNQPLTGLLRETVRITHPSGMIGDFKFANIRRRVGHRVLETKNVYGGNSWLDEYETSGNVIIQDGAVVTPACPPVESIDQTLLPDNPDASQTLAGITSEIGSLTTQLQDILKDMERQAQGDTDATGFGWSHAYVIEKQIRSAENMRDLVIRMMQKAAMEENDDGVSSNPLFMPNTLPGNLLKYRTMRALVEKKLYDPSEHYSTWTIDYQEVPLFHYANLSSVPTVSNDQHINWTKVIHPNGSQTTFSYHWDQAIFGGELKRQETTISPSSTTLLSETAYDYEMQLGFPARAHFPVMFAPARATEPVFITKTVTQQDGDTFTTEYTYETDVTASDYSYGHPIKTETYSNVTLTDPTHPKRITDTTYIHDTTKWILGLTDTVTQNGRLIRDYDYNTNGQVITEKRHDSNAGSGTYTYATFGYNADGTPSWAKDAELSEIRAENFKRGTAQKIIKGYNSADAITVEQKVDDNGWLTESIDGKGQITAYTRDTMGRLTKVNPPGLYFSDTDIAYDFTGPITQTITKGDAKTTITYDSLLRPTLAKTEATDTGWASYVKTTYDAAGQTTFTSFPAATEAAATIGTNFTYDGLGRVKTSVTPTAPQIMPIIPPTGVTFKTRKAIQPSPTRPDMTGRGADRPVLSINMRSGLGMRAGSPIYTIMSGAS